MTYLSVLAGFLGLASVQIASRFETAKFDGADNFDRDDPTAMPIKGRFTPRDVIVFFRTADDIRPLSAAILGGVIVVTAPPPRYTAAARAYVRFLWFFSTVLPGPAVWASSCSRFVSTKSSSRVVFIEPPERHALDRVIDYTQHDSFSSAATVTRGKVRCTRPLTLWPHVSRRLSSDANDVAVKKKKKMKKHRFNAFYILWLNAFGPRTSSARPADAYNYRSTRAQGRFSSR